MELPEFIRNVNPMFIYFAIGLLSIGLLGGIVKQMTKNKISQVNATFLAFLVIAGGVLATTSFKNQEVVYNSEVAVASFPNSSALISAVNNSEQKSLRVKMVSDKEMNMESMTHSTSEQTSWLKPVENKYVCMVNNKVFDTEQIPVEVKGKTYYGCCMMCKKKIERSLEIRTSTDPVSGKTVDKATATIGAAPDGSVYYFENEKNMRSFTQD